LVEVAVVVHERVLGEDIWEWLVAILQANIRKHIYTNFVEACDLLEELAGETVGDGHVVDNQGFPVFVLCAVRLNVGCGDDQLEDYCSTVLGEDLLQFPVVLRNAGPP
jgi:hypothetical protein